MRTRLGVGLAAGLLGGLVAGAVLWALWILPTLGVLLQEPTAGRGFLVHLGLSLVAGASFGPVVGVPRTWAKGLLAGAALGTVVWMVGPLLLVPAMLGFPAQLPFFWHYGASLGAYLTYGVVTGLSATALGLHAAGGGAGT
ncbi:MAG: hypothetical protein AB1445_08900 [Bacillota bacterium]